MTALKRRTELLELVAHAEDNLVEVVRGDAEFLRHLRTVAAGVTTDLPFSTDDESPAERRTSAFSRVTPRTLITMRTFASWKPSSARALFLLLFALLILSMLNSFLSHRGKRRAPANLTRTTISFRRFFHVSACTQNAERQ